MSSSSGICSEIFTVKTIRDEFALKESSEGVGEGRERRGEGEETGV